MGLQGEKNIGNKLQITVRFYSGEVIFDTYIFD